MTDLERAHTERAREDQWIAPSREQWNAALAAARREGAEQASGEIRALRKALHDETMKRLASAAEMRERALEAARDGVRVAFGERREFIDESDVIGSIEDAFASALPLTPEEP